MSGWIKFEKDLVTDPRVLRMAKALDDRLWMFPAGAALDPCNACALPGVTLVSGALARLWIYADSHAREDNTIDLGCAELDEHLGIEGFCSLMPEDWLIEIDAHTVELPGFQEHNGDNAKKLALTQKRVERHRQKSKRESVTGSNAPALPDQTRPDQTRPRKNTTASATPVWFAEFRRAYPPRAGDQGWGRALKAANARIAEGHSPVEFVDGAKRYAAFCKATEKTSTEFVKQAATFLGPDKPFLQPWNPPPSRGQQRQDANIQASQEWLELTANG